MSGITQALGLSVERAPVLPCGLALASGWVMELGGTVTMSKASSAMSRTMVRLIGGSFLPSDERKRNQLEYAGHLTRSFGLGGYVEAPGHALSFTSYIVRQIR